MSLGTDVAGALPFLRAQAESLMLDACTVQPVTGHTTNETTGVVTDTLGTAVYTGKCKVQAANAQEANPEAGGAILTVQRYAVHVPVGAFVPAVGQVVAITAAPLDANLVARQFRVVALLHKTLSTAYRLSVEEII